MLLGNPAYEVTAGQILLNSADITELSPGDRAARGLFLGFQHPEAIPGVSVLNLMRQSMSTRLGIDDYSVLEVRLKVLEWTKRLGMDSPLHRSLPERGLLQAASASATRSCRWRCCSPTVRGARRDPEQRPRRRRAAGGRSRIGIAEVRADRPQLGFLVITHYQRILDHLPPDVVYVLVDGRIVTSGGPEVAQQVEAEGFGAFRVVTA